MDDTRRQNDLQEESLETDQQEEVVGIEDKTDQELQQAKELAAQFENNYKRAIADYQNLQRRTQEEKSEWVQLAKGQAVLKLLPILDTLMLAEKHTKDQNFVMTVSQFLQVLKEEGFERIKALGETFDPLVMEPVGTKEGKEHIVLEEVKPGFKLGETVIRPAYVIVGQKEQKKE